MQVDKKKIKKKTEAAAKRTEPAARGGCGAEVRCRWRKPCPKPAESARDPPTATHSHPPGPPPPTHAAPVPSDRTTGVARTQADAEVPAARDGDGVEVRL